MAGQRLGACVRCVDPHPAQVTVHVMVGNEVYQLALCEAQARRLHDQQMQWARYGEAVVMQGDPRKPTERIKVPQARKPAQSVQLGLPLNFERWDVTDHARERQEERRLSDSEILWCAEFPDTKLPGRTPGTMVYKRGKVHLVVNPGTHRIITVVDREKVTEYATP